MDFLSSQPKKRIFSGIQPTGNLHIGNYLGAIKNWIKLQNDNQNIYSIVDMHALTIPENLSDLKEGVYEVAAAIIASGIDPKKSIIFNQSSVYEHAELSWIFNCIARIGWLNRMTQFKEKAGKKRDNASVGLFSYPVLMAADILLYRATHVPVGDDQKQHLELTRDIAISFNSIYSDKVGQDFFYLPEPIITGPAKRIMSLRDGSKKMSKSDISDASRINLTDDTDVIMKKIQKAKTDAFPIPDNVNELNGRLEAINLINIYSSLSEKNIDDVLNDFSGKGFSVFKKKLTDLVVEKINPISKEMKKLLDDKEEIKRTLLEGTSKARKISNLVIKDIKNIIGFIY